MCEFFRTFAPDMRKYAFIIAICASVLCAHAETLILRTGARVSGTIIFQNEEVVVIRDAEGARFQYPRTDIETISEEELPEEIVQEEEPEPVITTDKKASILLEIAGGAAVIPNEKAGGIVSADLLVGSHHIADRHLFIGGGLGYHGLFVGGEKYNFLPIQVALRMPFMETKHAPVFGASIGYGIALSKTFRGGIYAGIDLGYRCQLNPKTALAVVFFTQFQQAQITVIETIEDTPFVNYAGRNFISPGVKVGVYF